MNSSWVRLSGSILLLAILVFVSLPASAIEKGTVYGDPPTVKKAMSVSRLLADAENHLGQVVRVEGRVSSVCEKAGCWMMLTSDGKDAQEIRIKVTDGVIVFPQSARGKQATAEGVLKKVEMDLEQSRGYLKHHAEEQGEDFDPASVTEALVFYQIQGHGAVIR